MYFVNLPLFILFCAAVYLLGIYGLLTIAQVNNQDNKAIARNRKNSGNQIKVR